MSNLTRDGSRWPSPGVESLESRGWAVRARYRYLFVKMGAPGQLTASRHGSVHCAVQRRLLLLGFAV